MLSACWQCTIESGRDVQVFGFAFTSDGRQDEALDARSVKGSTLKTGAIERGKTLDV